jgi:hypothetical protein
MRCIWCVMVLSLCAAVLGCDSDKPAQPGSSPPDPVKYFRETQSNTMTPHGRVLTDTVTKTPDGLITYGTDDGSTWKVTASPNAEEATITGTR